MIIIAGIGLNSFDKISLKKILLTGADILRYNFSYRTIEVNFEYIKSARNIIYELNSSAKILADLPNDKIRLGDFDIKQFAVRENEEFLLQSASYSPDCNQFIPVNTFEVGNKIRLHQTLTIGDGEVGLYVTEIIDENKVKVKIINNGIISYTKSFNVDYRTSEKELLQNYEEIIKRLDEVKPDFCAISYINMKLNNKILKTFDKYKIRTKKIIKIEKEISDEELIDLLKNDNYKMLLIDRGEMGVNIPFEKIGIIQKNIFKLAKKYSKPVIVSTQILESTVKNFVPNRSEILDLTNIVIDGAKGIMLCSETAVGQRPAYTISTAKKIITEVEESI